MRNKRAVVEKLAEAKTIWSAEDRKFALAHFHPDRFKPGQRDQVTRVFQQFNNIPVIDR